MVPSPMCGQAFFYLKRQSITGGKRIGHPSRDDGNGLDGVDPYPANGDDLFDICSGHEPDTIWAQSKVLTDHVQVAFGVITIIREGDLKYEKSVRGGKTTAFDGRS